MVGKMWYILFHRSWLGSQIVDVAVIDQYKDELTATEECAKLAEKYGYTFNEDTGGWEKSTEDCFCTLYMTEQESEDSL
jgi:ferredoxin-thioredoxin reductase catalytic subunit